ncbi:ribonuclease H-like domain-containing protein [Rhizophagus irregularis DAOM 181602=DAOM 197198]|nr:ribonuclease H-like domain-containing protein [Rhizophagus irregularis DAOM 181602=DAOM 197198]
MAVSPGKFEAECKYCSKTWKHGKTPILEEHLANHCSNVPQLILREYMEKVKNRENTSNKKRKVDKSVIGQTTITAFHDSTNLPEARINRINCALVKFFIYCGIAYRIVEHPFFIDFLKELNADYDLPTREYLSGRLLETELCNVNEKMNEDIMNQHNLTLDLSLDSHTVEYLAVQIEEVIKKVKPERISAIVLDNATNIRKARKIINEKYPKIESVQCILHCINLIACDIVSHNFADRLLRRVNILLTTFFRNSHMAESGIKGGGLKSYCITRWTTSSESVNSVLNLKPVLEKMANEYENLLTNYRIKLIIQERNFFSDLEILAFVLNPLRKAIFFLESRSATLADCYLSLAKLGVVLKNLSRSFHCSFHVPLKSGVYARLAKTALSIGQNLEFDLEQSRALCSQLSQYRKKELPFDLEFGYGFQKPINWWNLIETKPDPESLPLRHLQLGVKTLESMCKMITYWKSNARKEFGFFGQEAKNKLKLNNIELIQKVTEALAESDNIDEEEDNEYENNSFDKSRKTYTKNNKW